MVLAAGRSSWRKGELSATDCAVAGAARPSANARKERCLTQEKVSLRGVLSSVLNHPSSRNDEQLAPAGRGGPIMGHEQSLRAVRRSPRSRGGGLRLAHSARRAGAPAAAVGQGAGAG